MRTRPEYGKRCCGDSRRSGPFESGIGTGNAREWRRLRRQPCGKPPAFRVIGNFVISIPFPERQSLSGFRVREHTMGLTLCRRLSQNGRQSRSPDQLKSRASRKLKTAKRMFCLSCCPVATTSKAMSSPPGNFCRKTAIGSIRHRDARRSTKLVRENWCR